MMKLLLPSSCSIVLQVMLLVVLVVTLGSNTAFGFVVNTNHPTTTTTEQQQQQQRALTKSTTTRRYANPREKDNILNKVRHALQDGDDKKAPSSVVDPQFESYLRSLFPGALTNHNFELGVFELLHTRGNNDNNGNGWNAQNTLLATSLCSDELAKRLSDDFVKIYGNNFHLGGLAGFAFAGNIGFETMAGHIPDDGYCLLLYGPHIGVCRDGTVGKVEREGVELVDDCCRSAIEAYQSLAGGGGPDDNNGNNDPMAAFTDMQQSAVKTLLQPVVETRLAVSDYPIVELPYALYELQDGFIQEIVNAGADKLKQGLALVGGIQINTGPGIPDYFYPLRFDYMDRNLEGGVEDLLPELMSRPQQ